MGAQSKIAHGANGIGDALRSGMQRRGIPAVAAIAGTVVISVFSANFINSSALANIGKGAVVFVGTVGGGLIGNWLAQH